MIDSIYFTLRLKRSNRLYKTYDPLIASKYLLSCSFTTGNKKNNPIMLGNTIANIIASENAQIELIFAAAPIITNKQNKSL